MIDLDKSLDKLWDTYSLFSPNVASIKKLLEDEGEEVINDHIAFRTIDYGDGSVSKLQEIFINNGYKVFDSYVFREKKLIANAYIHEDTTKPKIFLSGLNPYYFSNDLQRITKSFIDSGNLITTDQYNLLKEESEYAAWVCAYGFIPNHFTVSVNNLKKFTTIESILDFVESKGFKINESGSRVKGNKSLYLEQGSTMADKCNVKFKDGYMEIPSCYYEFALRYVMSNGELFQGFVETSADKIFESTYNKN